MKKVILFFLTLFTTHTLSAQEPYIDGFLPKWLTEEEKLRLHEIDYDRDPTDPPPQPSRNIAEFEPMSGALIRYPLGIPVSLVALMSEEIQVVSIVADQNTMNQAINVYQNNGVNMNNCSFLIAPTNSHWTRDYGPWFIFDDNNEIGIVDFEYDRPRPLDNAIPGIFAGENNINYYHMGLVHTGGDYMSDGMGVAASTTAAYSVNSANYTPAQVDSIMELYLGIDDYHVVPNIHGGLSHIDTWGKFLAPDKIMIREVHPSHPYYTHAEEAVEYFESQISSYGKSFQVYRVYTPNNEPYANSLILNNRVFVPLTGSQWDNAAIESFEEAMPGYEVHGIIFNNWHSTDALHCRVKEIADRNMLYIYHEPIIEDQQYHIDYEIQARIIPMSGEALYEDSIRVYYRVDEGEFAYEIMTPGEDHRYTACIPQQEIDSEISYYIHAADESGRSENHPYIGPYDPHTFNVTGPLVFLGADVDDSKYGNDNGIFEPGETVEIIATYRNEGQETIHNLIVDLHTSSQYITIHPPGQAIHETIEPEEEIEFSFTASSSFTTPDIYLASFNLEVETDEGFDSFDSFEIEITAHVIAEYFIEESFDDWLPEGWEVTSTSGQINWQHSNTNLAGGEAPEARFHYNPSTVAVQRLITPYINTTEYPLIALEYKHLINHYSGGYTLRVETSGDGGTTWTEIMAFPNANKPATTEDVIIDNEDVGSEEFRIAWTFDGDSWNINWWNIDDVIVGGMNLYDNIAFFEGQVSLNAGPGSVADVLINAGGQYTCPDENGFYSLAVIEGSHDITAGLPGYVPKTVEEIFIAEGDTIIIDFNLEYIAPPVNLAYEVDFNEITLMWEEYERKYAIISEADNTGKLQSQGKTNPDNRPVTYFNIYRSFDNDDFEIIGTSPENEYTDAVTDDGFYQYFVTAVYDYEYESEPSDTVGTNIYKVIFSVESENGELTATVGDTEIDSGELVEEGTDIVFTAIPYSGYRVKEWRVNGEIQENETDNIFILENIQATVEVTVEFEAITHKVTFSVVSGNGTLMAEVDGAGINPGDEVQEGSDVLFLATPDEGYEIHEWTINGNVIEGYKEPEYLIENLDADLDVNVEFKAITHEVAFSVVGGNGTLTAEVDGAGINSGDEVQEGSDVLFTAIPGEGYRISEWTVNGDIVEGYEEPQYLIEELDSDVDVNIAFKATTHKVTFSVVSGNGTLMAEVDGAGINSGDEVQEGSNVLFTATPDEDYKIHEWIINGNVIKGYEEPEYLIENLNADVDANVKFEEVTGTEDVSSASISVFPNPARDKFYVKSDEKIIHIRLIDIGGQVIKNIAVDDFHAKIDANNMRTGMYFIQIHTNNRLITERVQIIR